jgi:large conductance mechanosensitive channel
VIKEAVTLNYGSFINAVINFFLMAIVIFFLVKAVNLLVEGTKRKKKVEEETPAAPTTKICPFCKSEIAIEATRCAHCTSELPAEDAQ